MAYDTDASASCDRRCNYRWQDDVLAAVDWAWHIASLCHLLVCDVHLLDGTETHEDVFKENAHTEARDARCLHASELKQWSKMPRSQTVTTNLPHDGLRRSRSIGISVSRRQEERRHQTIQKKKPQHCRETVGVLSHGHKNLLIDCGDDLFSNDLLPSSSALLFWRSLEPVASNVVKLHVRNGKTNNTHTMERVVEKQRGRPSSLRLLAHRTARRGTSRNIFFGM